MSIDSAIHYAIKQAMKPLKFHEYSPEVIQEAHDAVEAILQSAFDNEHIVSYSVTNSTVEETRSITINASFSADPDVTHNDGVNITFACRQ